MDRPVVAVVLAGGAGTRLYPASRPGRPKQLLSLGGDRSMLARTLDRVAFADRRVVLTGPDHEAAVREELAAVGVDADAGADAGTDADTRGRGADAPARGDGAEAGGATGDGATVERTTADGVDDPVLVEPAARDTGPALVYAAARLRRDAGAGRSSGPEPVLFCVPSDHSVRGDFAGAARRACRVAADTGDLVALGSVPDGPATGYGYLVPAGDADSPIDSTVPGDPAATGDPAASGDLSATGNPGATGDPSATGDPVASDDPSATGDPSAPRVARFVEKPDADRARELVAAGAYWNAGTFAWTPSALLAAARDTPLGALARAARGDGDGHGHGHVGDDRGGGGGDGLRAAYADAPTVSVDHAVLERVADGPPDAPADRADGSDGGGDDVGATPALRVVPAGYRWRDLGSWDAVADALTGDGPTGGAPTEDAPGDGGSGPADAGESEGEGESEGDGGPRADADSAVLGDGLLVDATDTLVATDGRTHATALGVEGVVVAAYDDRVLVLDRDRAQDVRTVVDRLRAAGRYPGADADAERTGDSDAGTTDDTPAGTTDDTAAGPDSGSDPGDAGPDD